MTDFPSLEVTLGKLTDTSSDVMLSQIKAIESTGLRLRNFCIDDIEFECFTTFITKDKKAATFKQTLLWLAGVGWRSLLEVETDDYELQTEFDGSSDSSAPDGPLLYLSNRINEWKTEHADRLEDIPADTFGAMSLKRTD